MKVGNIIILFFFLGRINVSADTVSENNGNGEIIPRFQNISDDFLINKSFIIDQYDTVVFDLSLAIRNGSYIDIPVYILSDDSIFSLDFSLKFDHSKLEFDTIIDNATYLQSLSYYNPSDSTIRYTSSSFQNYRNDTTLVSIRFNTFSGEINLEDLNSLFSYLNGSSCSIKVINSLPVFIENIDEMVNVVKVFPNPANDILNINSDENISIQLLDINCREVYGTTILNSNQILEVDIHDFNPGIYLLRVYNENNYSIMKVIIEN